MTHLKTQQLFNEKESYIIDSHYRIYFSIGDKQYSKDLPKGLEVDGNSTPWPFGIIVKRNGPQGMRGVLHDALYADPKCGERIAVDSENARELWKKVVLTRKQCDQAHHYHFRRPLKVVHMVTEKEEVTDNWKKCNWIAARAAYYALRLLGWIAWNKHRKNRQIITGTLVDGNQFEKDD